MNAQQLKNAILQEAIEGRLVPQDPNDEPASALLARIRQEQEQLVKEGKLKKKDLEVKPISEDEIPFEIPDSWEWVRLGGIASYITDGEHKTPRRITNYCGYYLLSARNVLNGYINLENVDYVDKEEYENISRHCNPHFGDVLISCSGSVGRTAVVKDYNNYVMVRSAAVISPMYTDSDFLMYTLQSTELQSQIEESSKQTAQANLFQGAIKTLKIPLPPLAEQKRIVAKIEELLPKVEEYGKAQDALNKLNAELPERLKKSILQEAIEGRLVPQDPNDEPASILLERIREEKQSLFKEGKLKKKDLIENPISEDEIPFEIPENWEWYRLGQLTSLYTGNSISKDVKDSKYTNVKGRWYIATKDVNFDNTIDYDNGIYIPASDEPLFKIAPSGSILMCIEGGSAGRKIGIIDRDVCFGNKLCCFTPLVLNNRFFFYYLQSPIFKEIFEGNKKGIIGGVSINMLYPLLIPLPPLAEQHRIVEKLEQVLGEIDKLKK